MAYYRDDYGSRHTTIGCDPLEVRLSSLVSKFSYLTDLVKEIASRKTSSVEKIGTNAQYANMMDTSPTFHCITDLAYTYGGFPFLSQDPFSSQSSTYYPGWQHYPNPNEYGNGWKDDSFSSYKVTSPTTNHTFKNSDMSLKEMVQLIAFNTILYSFQRQAFQFQQETMAQIQDLTNQINEYISYQSRLEAKEEQARLVDESKWQATIDQKGEEMLTIDSHPGNKGENIVEQKPMVVPPPYLKPIVDKIKGEDDLIDTWETFTKLEEPMFDGMNGTWVMTFLPTYKKNYRQNEKAMHLKSGRTSRRPNMQRIHICGASIYQTPDRVYGRCLTKDVKEMRYMGGNPWVSKFLHLFFLFPFVVLPIII